MGVHVLDRGDARDVGGLVLNAKQEGLCGIPLLQPVKRLVGDDVRGVSNDLGGTRGADEVGVIVGTLATVTGEHLPVLKLVVRGVWDHMPLADEGGLVTRVGQLPGIDPLCSVPSGRWFVAENPVEMAVLARQNGGAAGTADGVADKRVVEDGPLVRDPVEVGRLVQGAVIRPDQLLGMVVAVDEEDVRSPLGTLRPRQDRGQ